MFETLEGTNFLLFMIGILILWCFNELSELGDN